MPITDPFDFTGPLEIRIEPVMNILQSMLLLVQAEKTEGYEQWIYETMFSMGKQLYHTHRLVLYGCHYMLFPKTRTEDFFEYLSVLKQENPEKMRNRMLRKYWSMDPFLPGFDSFELDQLLSSEAVYLDFLRSRFTEEYIDEELETEVYHLILNPRKMHEVIVSHLEYIWENYLQEQWNEHVDHLSEIAQTSAALNLQGMNRLDAARYITGQEFKEQKWIDLFKSDKRLIFVPSPHIGINCNKFCDDIVYIFFGMGISGEDTGSSEFNRAELAVKMSALGDSTRLLILKKIMEYGSLSSKEIIDMLQLSQSAGSRQLKQLSAVGFLNETRFEGGKKYSLNRDKFRQLTEQISEVFIWSKQDRKT